MSLGDSVKFTLGIPVYNEEKNIGLLLSEIESWKKDIEIIVVSSGSSDSTDNIVRSFRDVKLVVEESRKGKVSALNKITSMARGDVIIFTDGDVLLEKESIDALEKHFEDRDAVACTGRVVPIDGNSIIMNRLSLISCQVWDEHRINCVHSGGFLYPTGYLHAVRKSVIKTIDIDNQVINDDAVIGVLLFDQGITYKYCREAVVKVKFPDNLSDYFRQKVRTRLGRRQKSSCKILIDQEKELIRVLWSLNNVETTYSILLHFLDLTAKAIAFLKHFNISNKANLWVEVKSTK
ncbi:glycosyltransferase [Marinomonas mediterranea]|uniref:glycosyltransferase n=1 Tax=Marinomonas mediterranea TaxID=119864 RepID=UPI00234AC31B|nr:glycosyltransferase [Marinomonas mediterranea]WCN13649.1 glycosyltransferase [Marinomonas mediterranea]